ncbi:MAG: hypothetical protein LBR76_03770 [Oscillospiraceae bacterium]|jgi:hypothetical protein|nr:hypothetical protein [Oscillospiraceae bacterium]
MCIKRCLVLLAAAVFLCLLLCPHDNAESLSGANAHRAGAWFAYGLLSYTPQTGQIQPPDSAVGAAPEPPLLPLIPLIPLVLLMKGVYIPHRKNLFLALSLGGNAPPALSRVQSIGLAETGGVLCTTVCLEN